MIVEGYTNVFASYLSAHYFLNNAKEVLKQCYYKVSLSVTSLVREGAMACLGSMTFGRMRWSR